MKPVNTGLPQIGTYVDPGFNYSIRADQTTVPCGNGTWNNSPTSYTYRWLRKNDAIATPEIPGNPDYTNSSYYPTQADVGYYLICEVTAHNADGSEIALSTGTGYVTGPPVCINGPTIMPKTGGITGGTIGTLVTPGVPTTFTVGAVWYYSGLPAEGPLEYVWKKANPDGSVANMLAGGIQGNSTYICTPEDIGYRLYCEVTATNDLGSTMTTSDMTEVLVQGVPVRFFGSPTTSSQPGSPIIGGWYTFEGNAPILPPPMIPPPPPPPPPPSPPPPMPPGP